jgi:hypothetical protein
MEGGTTVASTYQIVLVKLKGVTAQKGDAFTIFKNMDDVDDPINGNSVGTEVETRAEGTILDPVEGAEDTYRMMINFTVAPVRMNDYVRPGKLIARAFFNKNGPTSAVSARIVNGEYNQRHEFSVNGVVYLNRGEQDGLQPGAILNVLKNVNFRNPDSRLRLDPKPIGLIKVVSVEPHVSTAVIVGEVDDIAPGDETSLVPANTSFKERPQTGSDILF